MPEYTEEELGKLKEFFDSYDQNGNGKLEFREFAHLVEALGSEALGPKMSPEETRIAFDKVDTDDDGTVDFDEFITWLGKQEH